MAERPRWSVGVKALLVASAFAAFAAAPVAGAAPRPQPTAFALAPVGPPGAVLLHGVAGRVLRGAVTVRNLSRHRITVTLQRADIGDASNGNADYLTSRVHGAGRWLHLQTTRVRLAAHAARRVGYAIRVPRRSTGVSHYAGIVAVNSAELGRARARARHPRRSFTFNRINRQALPITIRMPGRLVRVLRLRSVTLSVQPVGAAVVLGLRAGGSDLIPSTAITLHVLRGSRRLFSAATTLGQLFPGAPLAYRTPWKGRPAAGTYRVQGTIRPQGAAMIRVDARLTVSAAKARQLARGTTAATRQAIPRTPGWVWVALTLAATLLIVIPVAVWKRARSSAGPQVPGN